MLHATLGRTLPLALTVLLVIAAAAPAQVQRSAASGSPSGISFSWLMRPEFLPRDMPLFVDLLALDEDQAIIVEALLLDYEAAFQTALDEMRQSWQDRKPSSQAEGKRTAHRESLIEDFRQIRDEMRALREATPEGQPVDQAALLRIRARMEPLRAQLAGLQRERPSEEDIRRVRRELAALAKRWQAQRAALGQAFLADVQALLTPEQLERWDGFLRALRREKSLERGQLSGERTNLFHLLHRLDLSDADLGLLGDDLLAYEIDLDSVIIARDAHLDGGRDEYFDAIASGDTDRAAVLIGDEMRLRTAVRDVNHGYAERITAAMNERFTPQIGAAFHRAYLEDGFTRIYGTTIMERSFEVARGLDGLDPDVLAAIVDLEMQFRTELEETNAALLESTIRLEPGSAARRLRAQERARNARRERESGAAGDDPLRRLFMERMEMELRYRERLEALLTEEQIAKLPAMRSRERTDREAKDARQGSPPRGDFGSSGGG